MSKPYSRINRGEVCKRCNTRHPGWRHLWNAARMSQHKTENWGSLLARAPYDAARNLVPHWVAAIMHTKLTSVQRVRVLKAAADEDVRSRLHAVYLLTRGEDNYEELLRQAVP